MPNKSFTMIAGHLGQDPETKWGKSGNAFCNFSVATNSGKDETKKTTWHRCVAFGKYAEFVGGMGKGHAVIVIGRIEDERWTDKEGNEKSGQKVLCEIVGALPREESRSQKKGAPERAETPKREDRREHYSPPPEDEIPF